jgi:hypothetical protein
MYYLKIIIIIIIIGDTFDIESAHNEAKQQTYKKILNYTGNLDSILTNFHKKIIVYNDNNERNSDYDINNNNNNNIKNVEIKNNNNENNNNNNNNNTNIKNNNKITVDNNNNNNNNENKTDIDESTTIKLSQGVIKLIENLLQPQPNQRLNAEQILNSSWLIN